VTGLSLIDLFCGAGGLSEGFRQAGFRILAGSDIDPDACASFALNFPEAQSVHGDLRDASVREQLLARGNQALVVVGGPPCQAFSQMRNHTRLIDDPRNALYREFVRIVESVSPLVFVMENVPGLEQMGVRDQVVEDLRLRGRYRVSAQLVDAVDFGVPQTRRRIVFVGVHESLDREPPFIQGSGASVALWLTRRNGTQPIRYEVGGQPQLGVASFAERLLDPSDASVVTASQAIGDLAGLRAGTREDDLDSATLPPPASRFQELMRARADAALGNVSVPRIMTDTVARLAEIPEGGNYRDLPERLRERYLSGERWGPHSGSGRLDRRHYYAYRRLHRDFWSWTLNTKADSVYHYEQQRSLSAREFARLQSFPDCFRFTTDARKGPLPGRIEGGAAHSRYRQVGNAVPPLLARAIADSVKRVLAETREPMLTA
jgi:DNA (cytosine-5)-methyltransferase 1